MYNYFISVSINKTKTHLSSEDFKYCIVHELHGQILTLSGNPATFGPFVLLYVPGKKATLSGMDDHSFHFQMKH